MLKQNYQRTLRPKTEINWPNLPVYLSLQDVAHILNCSYCTVRNLVKDGVIPSISVGTRVTRVPKGELQKILNERKEENKDEKSNSGV